MSMPGQPAYLPIIIDSKKATEIMEREVEASLKRIVPGVEAAYPDKNFPGMVKLPARQRLIRYILQTDFRDISYIRDLEYIEKFRAGALPQVVSLFWQNLLSIPEAFKETQRDFVQLAANFVNKAD